LLLLFKEEMISGYFWFYRNEITFNGSWF